MSGFSLFRRTKKRRLGGHDARVGGDSGAGAAATAKSSSSKTARLARKRQRVTAAANGAGGGAGAEEHDEEEEVAAQGDSATSSSDSGSDDSDASDSDDSSSSNSGDSDAEEANNFNELGIAQWLVDACSGMDIVVPTPVQSACIPEVLKGRDVLGCSPTGSGKTAAFALPILHRLSEDPYGIYALILTPGRELAMQISDQFAAFGAPMGLRHTTVIGGMDMTKQALELAKRPHVVIATPGRLADFIERSPTPIKLSKLKFLVLDEADRLLDASIAPDMATIVAALPARRQTLLFSATMTKDLKRLNELALTNPYRWSQGARPTTVDTLEQYYVFLPSQTKPSMLAHIVKTHGPKLQERNEGGGAESGDASTHAKEKRADSIIIFTGTCYSAQLLTEMLTELEVLCVGLHSKISQRRRLAALGKFKSGITKVLVATDVASRGLDIPAVEMVINYDVPRVADDYIHRVGRTARAGRGGRAVTLVTQYDVQLLQAIEARTGKKMERFADADEEAALTMMGKVTTARQMARMRLMETGFEERIKKDKERKLSRK